MAILSSFFMLISLLQEASTMSTWFWWLISSSHPSSPFILVWTFLGLLFQPLMQLYTKKRIICRILEYHSYRNRQMLYLYWPQEESFLLVRMDFRLRFQDLAVASPKMHKLMRYSFARTRSNTVIAFIIQSTCLQMCQKYQPASSSQTPKLLKAYIVMMSKLERYSKYIQLPRAQKLQLINQANPSEQHRTAVPRGLATFSEQNFAYLTVFDAKKAENIYKLRTYREGREITNPKAIVAMFHGLKSHCNWGAHLAKHFATRNIITVGYDYRGYGKSEGLRGYMQSFDSLMRDSQKFVNLTKEIYPSVPIYGLGVSLGGAVAYELSLKHREMFNGTVLMAPSLKPALQYASTFSLQNFILRLIEFILPRELHVAKLKHQQNSKNPNYQHYCQEDPLFQSEKIRLSTLLTLFQILKQGADKFEQYDVPFMVVQGGADRRISPEVAFELFAKSKTRVEDKQLLFYEQMMHDVWAESEIHQIQGKVADWILAQAQKVNRK